mgnify:FL=1
MAVNPSANIQFLDGSLQAALNLATNTAIKLGVASGGPLLRPTLCTQASSVLQFFHGPLVASGGHHTTYSGPCYLMRINGSTNGTIGSVTKTPASSSPTSYGNMTATLNSYTLHAAVDASTASSTVNYNAFMATGWTTPSVPLPLTVTAGVDTVAHTLTITYVDVNGDTTSGTLSVTAAGTFVTSFTVAKVLSITASVAPIGTQAITTVFSTPGDRYYAKVQVQSGGVIGVSGGTVPKVLVSLDNGYSYSRPLTLASTGLLEMTTYAGGQTPQPTGVLLTFANATALAVPVLGSLRLTGATVPGDVVYTKKVDAAVTVAHVIAGLATPFSVGVIGNAITVNSATDGAGLATTTANDIVAGILGSVAASALVSSVAVGTGLGLIAAHGATGFADSQVAYTPKVEGVQVRHGNPGASNTAISVVVSGKSITVYPVTDANGVQTSTATAIAAAVNASTTATLLVSAAASGAGTGIVGMQSSYQALAVTCATGDVYTFETTPPSWTNADLAEALAVLYANEAALDGFSVGHVVGDAAQTDVTTMNDWLDTLANSKRKFKSFTLEGTFMGNTSESTWKAALLANFTEIATNPHVALAAGEVQTINPLYGTTDRRNVGTSYMARLMICSISELPSHVECTTDFGIQTDVRGVTTRVASTTVTPLWQSEDTLIELNSDNMVTYRTWPGRTGLYVRQGLMFTVTGDDYMYVTNRRTLDVVAAVAYDEIIKNVNANLLTDPRTGQLAEIEAQRLESNVSDRIRREVMGGARQHISAVQTVIDRGTNFQATGAITGQVSVVGRTPATSITLRLGYVRTLNT